MDSQQKRMEILKILADDERYLNDFFYKETLDRYGWEYDTGSSKWREFSARKVSSRWWIFLNQN